MYQDIDGLDADVWVVDNNSKDGSAEAVRASYPQTHVIENNKNAGFGAANNLAMREATGKYYLLINSDAFPKPGAIPTLIEVAKSQPKAAIVGPRLLNEDGSLQISCYKFPSPSRAWLENLWLSTVFHSHPRLGDYRRWNHDSAMAVDSVIGACMLIRREAFEETGGFDERYFMYQEETDWQKTLREHGWIVYFTPASVVTHLGGASGKEESVKVSEHFFESLDLYERKHHGFVGFVSVRAAMVFGCFTRACIWGALTLSPGKRKSAGAKARFHTRLLWRQATHWHTGLKSN